MFRSLVHRITDLDPRTRRDLVDEIQENLNDISMDTSDTSNASQKDNIILWDDTNEALTSSLAQYTKMDQFAQFLSTRAASHRSLLQKRERHIQTMISLREEVNGKKKGADIETCDQTPTSTSIPTLESIQTLQKQQKHDTALLQKVCQSHDSICVTIRELGTTIQTLQDKLGDITEKRGELEEFVAEALKAQEEEDRNICAVFANTEDFPSNGGDDVELRQTSTSESLP